MDEKIIEHAYELARKVEEGKIRETDALKDLRRMDPAKNFSDMVRNLRQMLKGESYHRTLTLQITRRFLEYIYRDFGEDGLKLAIHSVFKNIEYRKTFATGGNQPSLVKLCREFEANQLINSATFTFEDVTRRFEENLERSEKDKQRERLRRLETAEKYPKKSCGTKHFL